MKYYAFVENNKLNGRGRCRCLNEEIQNIEITEEVFNNIDKYTWDGSNIVLNPDYEAEQLEKAKATKYEEAKTKAYSYINNGEALYEFESNKHIEATDGNIAKLGLSLIQLMITEDTETTISWNTKEDENVELNLAQLQNIVSGLKQIQEEVWTVKFTDYVTAIEEASTIEEVEAIEIEYKEREE